MLTPPIPVALPLAVAALLAALNRRIPRPISLLLAIVTSIAVGLVAISLAVNTRYDPYVYWFGGWAPRGHAAIGICFVIDNTGAIVALLTSVLVTTALIFSWSYFDTAGTLFQVLMLVFLGAACGFSFTGDLFNLFVFFELMSVAAFALCGYKSESPGPLEGALNFAVTNTVGAFLVLTGIALLYGRTGALNMAQIGRTLGNRADALVLAALALLACGFFVKAAIVPFHFWLADAHAVAPAPVCVLFSGIMVELGLYAVARIYWTVFSGAMAAHENELRNLLAAFGAATAVLGAFMCYAQRHLKRLLAFSTISHMGLILLGVSLLTPEGLAGASLYTLGHSLIKGGLFLCAGILLHRTGSVDEIELAGRIRNMRWAGALFLLGGAGLAGIPPFGTFWGEAMVSASVEKLGYRWMDWVFVFAGLTTGAAVFRFAGRVFFGWGPHDEEFAEAGASIPEKFDTQGGHGHTPPSMFLTAAALILFGAGVGLAPRLTGAAQSAAIHLQNRQAYAQRVLDLLAPYPPVVHDQPATPGDLGRAGLSILAAALLAAATLGSARARRAVGGNRALVRIVKTFRDLHSGIIPDYVTWLMVGVALFGAAAFLSIR